MRRVARVAMAIAMALGFAPVAHADMKALEEAAKKEGEITWYTSHYTSEGAEDLGAASPRCTASRRTWCA